MAEAECHRCEAEIEFEEWTSEVVVCPACGFRHEANADYIDVSEGSWSFWLEPLENQTNG